MNTHTDRLADGHTFPKRPFRCFDISSRDDFKSFICLWFYTWEHKIAIFVKYPKMLFMRLYSCCNKRLKPHFCYLVKFFHIKVTSSKKVEEGAKWFGNFFWFDFSGGKWSKGDTVNWIQDKCIKTGGDLIVSQKYCDQKEQKAPDNPTLLVSIRIYVPVLFCYSVSVFKIAIFAIGR